MPPGAEQIAVRQHERIHCRLPLQVRVAQEVGEQVSLSRTACDATGAVEAFITDASRGGLGIESPVFLPRGSRLRVRLSKGAAPATPDQDILVRVQRVSMLDRTPKYYLGVSFASKGPEHERALGAMLDAARQTEVAGVPVAAIGPGKGGG